MPPEGVPWAFHLNSMVFRHQPLSLNAVSRKVALWTTPLQAPTVFLHHFFMQELRQEGPLYQSRCCILEALLLLSPLVADAGPPLRSIAPLLLRQLLPAAPGPAATPGFGSGLLRHLALALLHCCAAPPWRSAELIGSAPAAAPSPNAAPRAGGCLHFMKLHLQPPDECNAHCVVVRAMPR